MCTPPVAADVRLPQLLTELVPETCWLSTVRSYLSEHYWRKLSRDVSERSGRRCEICGGRGRRHAVECHEVWAYRDDIHVQKLEGLQALCPMCHRVKHLGRSIELGYEEQALGWLARLNRWDAATTRAYVDFVFEQWRERSEHAWGLDVTVLGEVYEIPLERLELPGYQIPAVERRQLLHHREISIEDVFDRDGRRVDPPPHYRPPLNGREGF
jgi:hypothetical protein